MSTPRFVRGTKSRLFLYLGAVTVIGVVVYVFHGSQVQLEEVRKTSKKCLQQQESLSAQLQVIFEYKLRLEKSLQQEKAEHRQTREELQGRVDEEKQLREKENLESINKYSSLQQQYKLLQSRHEDLNDECSKLRETQNQGLEERSKLEAAVQAVQQELEQVQASKEKDMEALKSQFMRLEVENEKLLKQYKDVVAQTQDSTSHMNHLDKENIQLKQQIADFKNELKTCVRKLELPEAINNIPHGRVGKQNAVDRVDAQKLRKAPSSPVAVVQEDVNQNVLQLPEKQGPADKVSLGSHKSTTPQINPDAVLSNEKTANVVPVPPPREQADKQLHDSPVGARPLNKESGDTDKEAVRDLNGEGAVPAPNWGVQDHPNVIPNQPAFNAIPVGHFIDGYPNQHQRFNVPPGVVPAPHGYGVYHNAESVVHPPEHENAINNIAHQDNNMWPWKGYKQHWVPVPQPVGQARNDIRLEEDNAQDIEVGDNPMNQRHNDLGPRVEQNNNNRRNGQDLQRRRQLAEPHRNVIGDHEENHRGAGEEEKEIPRQLHNPYEYNGEYEKDRQRGDLQLEEGEEDDDDMDQIDYANEGGNAAARQKHINIKQPIVNMNKHESVMVNPK